MLRFWVLCIQMVTVTKFKKLFVSDGPDVRCRHQMAQGHDLARSFGAHHEVHRDWHLAGSKELSSRGSPPPQHQSGSIAGSGGFHAPFRVRYTNFPVAFNYK